MAKTKIKIDWDKQIKKINRYARKHGYQVIITKAPKGISTIDFNSKIIRIHSSMIKERQLYTILHELGHHIINETNKEEYKDTLGFQYDSFGKNSMSYKVTEIEEEIEAWRLGYKLALELNIKIDRISYEIYKSSLLKTYMLAALRTSLKKDSNDTKLFITLDKNEVENNIKA